MKRAQTYVIRNYEQLFVLVVLITVAVINYYIPQKTAFINFYFLPVILAGYFLDIRRSVLGGVFCILLVVTYMIIYPDYFIMPQTPQDLYVHLLTWGSFLILAGVVVGKQSEHLKLEIELTRCLNNKLLESFKHIKETRNATILGLAKLSEYRDEDTGAHLERIREYARILAQELANHSKYRDVITEKYVDDIYQSSILHDIGKVGIPDAILLKPERLTDEEFQSIKRHAGFGGDVLKIIESQIEGRSFLSCAKEIAYCHHEKWDGSGYPRGLKGDEIPLPARIVALADVYDALTSKRIYKEAFSHDEARAIIVTESGRHFDPDVVAAFMTHEDEFRKIRKQLHG